MRWGLAVLALAPLFAQSSDEKDAVATVEKTFAAMKAHDGEMLKATMLPDSRLYSVRDGGVPLSRSFDEFSKSIVPSKAELIERFTAKPQVSIRGTMAQVWGEYEFLRDGKFTHCGVDSVSLFKTPDGWRIATIVYTVETTGCKGR